MLPTRRANAFESQYKEKASRRLCAVLKLNAFTLFPPVTLGPIGGKT